MCAFARNHLAYAAAGYSRRLELPSILDYVQTGRGESSEIKTTQMEFDALLEDGIGFSRLSPYEADLRRWGRRLNGVVDTGTRAARFELIWRT